MLFADIAFPLKIYHALTYRVPAELEDKISPGDIVLCPLKTKALKYGCVLSLHNKEPGFKARELAEIANPAFRLPASVIELCLWISRYYCQAAGPILEHASFWGIKAPVISWKKYLFLEKLPGQEEVQEAVYQACIDLKVEKYSTRPAFLKKRGIKESVLEELVHKNLVSQIELPGKLSADHSRYFDKNISHKPQFHTLTKAQQKMKAEFSRQIELKPNPVFLLHGITGSGKTELYSHVIEKVIKEGKDVIFLVPEVSLVGPAVRYLEQRFGNMVAWYHYLRTPSDKLIVSWLIKQRKVRILVGTRSAVFAPFSRLGLILVDEEHSGSYKAEDTLNYHARDVAVYRGHLENIPVMLGSATPSVESCYQAKKGKYVYLSLPERFNLNPLPAINIIDLTVHLRGYDSQTQISAPLKERIIHALAEKKQVLLFLNRRGHSNFQMCLKCGKPVMCVHCHITLTFHKKNRRLKCHYCGYQCPPQKSCTECGSEKLQYFGTGTQKVEENIRNEFSHAGILRIDSDIMNTPKKLKEMDAMIQSGKYNILIGTQMIAKGLHLEDLSLVGILDVDYLLTLPDFRAAKKTFSLVLQAAGRAGRASASGEVYIQTFMKDHPVFRSLENHNYDDFYQPEIKFRRSFMFPPFRRLIKVLVTGIQEEKVQKACYSLAGFLSEHPSRNYHIIGPSRCPVERIKSRYRYMFIVRYRYPSPVQNILRQVLNGSSQFTCPSACTINIDVDPQNFL